MKTREMDVLWVFLEASKENDCFDDETHTNQPKTPYKSYFKYIEY